jgi:hypothetical protein
MYQWKEVEHTTYTTDKEGKTQTNVSYTYEKVWSTYHLDVKHSPGQRNPAFPEYVGWFSSSLVFLSSSFILQSNVNLFIILFI